MLKRIKNTYFQNNVWDIQKSELRPETKAHFLILRFVVTEKNKNKVLSPLSLFLDFSHKKEKMQKKRDFHVISTLFF